MANDDDAPFEIDPTTHECDRCGGSGEVLDHVDDNGHVVTRKCPMCGGAGVKE